jgi:hypothetical protein
MPRPGLPLVHFNDRCCGNVAELPPAPLPDQFVILTTPSEHLGIARFLIESLDRFSSFEGRDLDTPTHP